MSNVGRKKNGDARSSSASGLIGAMSGGNHGYAKWISRIRVKGKTIQLRNKDGRTYFHSAQEAHDAYIEAAIKYGINLSI